MSGKILKEKLTKGETVYGTFFQHAINPAMVDFLPPGALDFVIVTPEHTALDLAEFLPIRYALASKGIACLARTHSREPDDVSKVCDSFDGVVVPYVEDVEQAKRLKELERENARLRRLVADLSLEKQVLKDVAQGNL